MIGPRSGDNKHVFDRGRVIKGDFIQPGENKLEKAKKLFWRIGCGVMAGSLVGSCFAFVATNESLDKVLPSKGKLYLLKETMKGARLGSCVGIVLVLFSAVEGCLVAVRGVQDEANTVLAATATGYLYNSLSGLKRVVVGGAAGYTLGCAFALANGGPSLWQEWENNSNEILSYITVNKPRKSFN